MLSNISEPLITTLSAHLRLSKSRLETLVKLLLLLVNVRTVNLTHIAAQFSSSAKPASSYRRLQRFFQFVRLDAAWLARVIVQALNIRPPWILCLDRTNWKFGKRNVNILMLAIVTSRVRIPLMWAMLDKQGASNCAERIALLQRYLDIFGADSIRHLLADREFVGQKWMGFLIKNKIMFSIRVKGKTYVRFAGGAICMLQTFARNRNTWARLRSLPACFATMPESLGHPLRFACKRLKNGEMLFIVTNSDEPLQAMNVYKRRWFIECLFADSKSRGMNLEDTAMTDTEKLSTLLAIVTLAMVFSYACARKLPRRQRSRKGPHGYPRKSCFRTGFDALRNWIIHDANAVIALWKEIWKRHKSDLAGKGVV